MPERHGCRDECLGEAGFGADRNVLHFTFDCLALPKEKNAAVAGD